MGAIRAEVSLQMGMAGCKVNVEAAVGESKETQFNNVCCGVEKAHDPSGVKQLYECPVCKNSDKETFRKGRVTKSAVTLVSQDEIDEATAVGDDVTKVIELTIHPREQIRDLLPAGAPYWLVPNNNAEQERYAAFVKALEGSPDKVALAEWAPRTKTGLFEVQVLDGALAFQKLAWPEDVRPAPRVDASPSEKVIGQMGVLMDMALSDFDVNDYRDTRRERIAALVDGADVVELATAAPKSGSKPQSLEDQLAAAIEAAQKGKAKPVKGAEAKAKPAVTEGKKTATPRKRTPAKAS